MQWIELEFGKHSGRSLPQIAFANPGYLLWLQERDVLKTRELRRQLSYVLWRAQHILIPDNVDGNRRVRYYGKDWTEKRTTKVEVVGAEVPSPKSVFSRDVEYFDLLYAVKRDGFDKSGTRLIVAAVKRRVFGDPEVRLTRAWIEDFFNDGSKFEKAPHF